MRKLSFLSILIILIVLTTVTVRPSFTGDKVYEYVDDETITAKAKAIIAEDPAGHALKVNVDSTAGDVVLTGSVNSVVTKNRIISRIKLIKGVKSVRSLLKVKD